MMMSSFASINRSTPSRRRKAPEESSQQEKKKSRPNAGTRIGERGLPLIVMAAPFLPCRDIGRLLLCTSKALLAAGTTDDSNNANDVVPTPTEWVYKCLCLQYWGAYSSGTDPEFVQEFVQKTGLQSYERCFRELSHFETIRRPHKYFYPFVIAGTDAIPPPPRTVYPSDFTLVVNLRRRITGKRLVCAALTGSQLDGFFKNGFLPVGLTARHRPHTEIEDSDMDIQTTSSSGDELFSWEGEVHLIRRSDQTMVKLLDLHETDTLYKNSIFQENDLIQDSREWKFRNCLLPKTSHLSRIMGLSIPCDPPHQELSLPSLFGCGIIRLGLILEYTRTELSSPFQVAGFRLHANLLSRRLQQEFPLFALLKETDWHFSHVLQMLHVFSNDGGDVARDATS